MEGGRLIDKFKLVDIRLYYAYGIVSLHMRDGFK